MKKSIITILLLSIIFGGCGTNKSKDDVYNNSTKGNEEVNNNNSAADDEVDNKPLKEETFAKENYENFPEVKNIVTYLDEPAKDVKVLKQTDKSLVFCLPLEEKNSDIEVENYIKSLENDGYQLELLDGTISSTFVMKKGDSEIKITSISQIEEWKEVHKDEYHTKDIGAENLVYEISGK